MQSFLHKVKFIFLFKPHIIVHFTSQGGYGNLIDASINSWDGVMDSTYVTTNMIININTTHFLSVLIPIILLDAYQLLLKLFICVLGFTKDLICSHKSGQMFSKKKWSNVL